MAAQERRKCSNAKQRRRRAKKRKQEETRDAIAADPKLLAQAIANKWPVPKELMDAVVSRLNTVVRSNPDDPTAIKAANATIAMIRSNIAAERAGQPDVVVNNTIQNNIPTRDAISDMLDNLT